MGKKWIVSGIQTNKISEQKIQGVAIGFAMWTLLFISIACSSGKLASLRVEYEETPLGIDVEQPRFSWQMESPKQSQ